MIDLFFGYCDTTILPYGSIGLGGYKMRWNKGFENSGVLDPIYAKALSLKLDEDELMIVSVDVCGFTPDSADEIRMGISQKTGIPVSHIMLCAIHTHSAPATSADLRISLEPDMDEAEIDQSIKSYMQILKSKVIAICAEAHFRKHKARLTTSTLRTYLGYNRRYPYTDKSGEIKCRMLTSRWQHPLHDAPGTIDPDIPILMLERIEDGEEDSFLNQNGLSRVIVFNVPYHPVVMGGCSFKISADYPGAACKCIEEGIGDGTKAVFLLGACGNTQPMFGCQFNPKAVEIIGKAIGYSVIAALVDRKEVKITKLGATEEQIEVDSPYISKLVTQVFKIGDVAIAAVSAECFTELGIKVRKESGFKQTLVCTSANGGGGYLPTEEAFEQGGYEVEIAKAIGYEKNILEFVAEKIVSSCRKLK